MTPPLLPHAPPMHWLDHASLSSDTLTAFASRLITPDHPFLIDGQLLPTALIELMAQCAAAGTAIKVRSDPRRIRKGVLAAIRNFQILQPASVGSTVFLTAFHQRSFGPLSLVHAQAAVNDTLIATAQLTFHVEFE
jgi:predicted hotdog family 3-hydroxylacyl-ACP dehydratase